MQIDKFPTEVAERLQWYVYRLIDPRNGETFYVGKGRDNRIFEHAKGALANSGDEDAVDLRVKRIREIVAAGLEVAHVIHRHGIKDENVAFQIEAALIDAYPGLANKVSGHGSDDYGVRHVQEIIAEFAAIEFIPLEPLILISIARSYEVEERSIYDAVRCCWRIDARRAQQFKLVLAHRRGLVVGAFRPNHWLPGTSANFPWHDDDVRGRCGFVGESADQDTQSLYVGKRVPDKYRPKGAANPVRFIDPDVPV